MSDETTPEEVVETVEEVVEVESVEEVAEAVESAEAEEAPAEDAAVEEPAAEEPVAEKAPEKEAAKPAAEEPVAEKEAAKPAAAEKNNEEGGSLTANMIPPEYVPAVRRGRNRRINIDINLVDVHYKNIPLLTRFLDPFGRILSRRKTKVSAKVQRNAVTAIKRARHLSLLPYTGNHTRLTRRKKR